jgi:hypothetical protein
MQATRVSYVEDDAESVLHSWNTQDVIYDKVRQSVTSKGKQSMDQSQARIKSFRACDWSMLCFALLCSENFDALCHVSSNHGLTCGG